jgi:hypothetical protein
MMKTHGSVMQISVTLTLHTGNREMPTLSAKIVLDERFLASHPRQPENMFRTFEQNLSRVKNIVVSQYWIDEWWG